MGRRDLLLGGVAALAATRTSAEAATVQTFPPDPDEVIPLWSGLPPGGAATLPVEEIVERPHPQGLRDRIVRGVVTPQLTIFRARRPEGTGFLIIPGGGYRHVVIDKEGFETARWLAARGCTVGVLRYRLPGDGWLAAAEAPLQDAQRALRVLRARAREFDFKPDRLGVEGFSAGGHVAARLASEFAQDAYAPLDATDAQSARPDFAALIYPVITMRAGDAHPGSRERLIGPSPSDALIARYSAENHVPDDAPPTFILHATDDDSVPVANALVMYQALLRAGVKVEMHLFERGGHGFGLRAIAGKPVAAWPGLLQRWAEQAGFMPTSAQG